MIWINWNGLYISTVAFKRKKFESGPATSEVLSSQWLAAEKHNSSLKLQGSLITPVIAGDSSSKETYTFFFGGDDCSTVGQRELQCFQVQFYNSEEWIVNTDRFPM